MKHKAKKKFGQNFLIDEYIINQIISYINPSDAHTNIEIGPGLGAITNIVLNYVEELKAIEIDPDVINKLKNPKLTIYNNDVLELDFNQFKQENKKLKIFGNLPYNIATAIMIKMTDYANDIESMCFMVQKEVADKIIESSKQSRLKIFMEYHFDIYKILEIPPQAFEPPPKVDSALIYLKPKQIKDKKCDSINILTQVTKQAFSMKRKTIKNNLKTFISAAELETININPATRPEEITIKEYIEIANFINSKRKKDNGQLLHR